MSGIDIYVGNFGTIELSPETKKRFEELGDNWEKIMRSKAMRMTKKNRAIQENAKTLCDELDNAVLNFLEVY